MFCYIMSVQNKLGKERKMETKIKKITSVLLLAIMIIAMASVPVLATTNEKVILKNSAKKIFNSQLAKTTKQ